MYYLDNADYHYMFNKKLYFLYHLNSSIYKNTI